MKANYHTHTYRCRHAIGTEESYVKAAIKAGIQVLGMSDHCPWPEVRMTNMRMDMRELDSYINKLKDCRRKYKGKIEIKIGLECEFFPDQMDTLKMFFHHPDIDYLIFGNHFHRKEGRGLYYGNNIRDAQMMQLYVDDAIAGMQSGLYKAFAHPDLCFREWPVFDEVARKASYDICHVAKKYNIPLEYNLGGLRMYKHQAPRYPRYEFWQIAAEVENQVIIGVDAHNPADLRDEEMYHYALDALHNLGIKNILDFLEV